MVAPCALVLFAAGDTAACAAFVGAGLGTAVGVVGAWANTLAWEDPLQDITYRLETRLSQTEAVRFAESLQYVR